MVLYYQSCTYFTLASMRSRCILEELLLVTLNITLQSLYLFLSLFQPVFISLQ
jgi:hypothetical protein